VCLLLSVLTARLVIAHHDQAWGDREVLPNCRCASGTVANRLAGPNVSRSRQISGNHHPEGDEFGSGFRTFRPSNRALSQPGDRWSPSARRTMIQRDVVTGYSDSFPPWTQYPAT
jgi:hypothetical protein